jgi:autotransporter-associated beta strand protein
VRSGTTSLVKRGSGTLILDRANTHSGGTTIEAGELIIRNSAALGAGGLTVKSGATVTLDVGTNSVAVGALTVESGGRIDLGYGQVAIAAGGSPLPAVRQRLQRSYESGWTTGDGFMTRLAATVEGGRLGYLVHDDTSLTVGFAAAGDTNLDGVIDIIDCANLVSLGKFNSDESAAWTEGDFNYDGVVDVLDVVEFMATGLFNADAYVPPQSAPSAAAPELSAIAAAFLSFSVDSTTTSTTTPRKRAFARL